jgi:hypothetical protein
MRKMVIEMKIYLAVMVFCLVMSASASAQSYPVPASIRKTFDVFDVSKADISLQIKARDGRALYTLQCHSAGYKGDSSFDYSGDFECRLILSDGQNTYSTLLTEDLDQSRDWESRGRFFAASLRGECAKIPEFGAVRNFTLRGMRLTLRIFDPTFQDNKLLSLKLAVAVAPDPNAHRAIAEIVPFPKSGVPASCDLSKYFVNSAQMADNHK